MIRTLLALCVLLCCSSAKAQTGQIINCPITNTTMFNSGPSSLFGNPAISNCVYTLPPTAMAYFFVQATVTCVNPSDIRLNFIGGASVTYPNFGASFNGQITGNVLTVNSMISSPPNVILPSSSSATTPRLYDAFSGSKIPIDAGADDTALWITSQLTSNELGGAFGGKGTYQLNTSVGTPIPAETMWALPYRAAATFESSKIYEQAQCQNGTTVIESFGGSLPAGSQGTQGYILWVQVEMIAEKQGSNPPQSASIVNGQIFIVMPSMLQGGLR